MVPARQRHCHQRRFGQGSYACWGLLAVVVRKRKTPTVPTPAGLGIGWQLGEEARAMQFGTQRLEAMARLKRTMALIDKKTRAMAALARQVHALRLKCVRYEKKASMTDAEFLALQARGRQAYAKGRQARAPRAVKVGGTL